MENRKIRVAITHGDTNGIGYELIFKAFEEPEMLDLCTPIIYGSPKIAAYHSNALGIEDKKFTIIGTASEAQDNQLNMLPVFDDDVKVDLGIPTQEATSAAVKSLDRAITDYKDDLFDVLVAAPVDSDNNKVDGYQFPRTDLYVESCIGDGKHGIDIRVNETLRLALMTDKVAMKDVSAAITAEAVIDKVALFFAALRRDFRIDSPRIAILALNPTDSDEHPGKEEAEALVPAIQKLAEAGLSVFGPYQADKFFGEGQYTAFDGVLAMYHDQGVAPFKALEQEYSFHYFGGLPLVVTAADHGPCYDIAGQGKADATSFRHAIWAAVDGFRNRMGYAEPYANPLPKLYRERKDDSEKTRFNIPKKREPRTTPPAPKPAPKQATKSADEAQ